MIFRQKPVTIEAILFDGTNLETIRQFVGEALITVPLSLTEEEPVAAFINTLEGKMKVVPGDVIIKGVKGEFYPCKSDIFAATYERIEGETEGSLPPHQQRVLDEHTQLFDRVNKLGAFINNSETFKTLPAEEMQRLMRQHSLMMQYQDVLEARISDF